MAPDAQSPSRLIDFLYRDPARIPSYYAQIFSGLLKSVETSTADKKSSEIGGGIAEVIRGKRLTEVGGGRKETIDPNDLLATDLITRLVDDGRVFAGHSANGPLVRVDGTLFMLDGSIIRVGLSVLESAHQLIPGVEGAMIPQLLAAVRGAIAASPIPSVFILKDQAGRLYSGTIKESGLDEPIAAFNMKFGSGGVPAVVVGIKESILPLNLGEGGGLLQAAQDYAKAIGSLVLPEGTVRLTPLAIYREV